jgi:DNA polymerase-3 subunit beta
VLEVVRRVGRDGAAQLAAPAPLRGGRAHVSAQTQDVGEAQESMPAPYTGEPLEIGFNAEFLRDGLESIGGDELPSS